MKITVLKICMPEGINYLKKWNVYTSTVLLNTIIEAEQKCWNYWRNFLNPWIEY
jgi:hypothetical protein